MFYLQSTCINNYFRLEMTGTTIFNLSLNSIRKMKICLPLIDEQDKIVKYLISKNQKISSIMSKVKEAIDKLDEYRSSIITSTVTGKIDVRNIKIKKV